jgi:hypothetical protein
MAIETKRNCGRVTDRGKEAWSETAGRRTETGYKALFIWASGQQTAKLPWSKINGVNPAVARRRVDVLSGEISPCA